MAGQCKQSEGPGTAAGLCRVSELSGMAAGGRRQSVRETAVDWYRWVVFAWRRLAAEAERAAEWCK